MRPDTHPEPDALAAAPPPSVDPALEWPRFLALAQAEARTDLGKSKLAALEHAESWASNLASAARMQDETEELALLLDRDGLWGPLSELGDPDDRLDQLARGGVLEIGDLALIRRWLFAIDSWTQTPRDEIRGELFRNALEGLPDPGRPLQILNRVLTPEGELSERASPKLAALYQEIRSLKREIGSVLDQLVKTLSTKGVLQENFSDVRDGRFVIPVKISHQGDIDGIIYEASASRQTVFVEPREVSPLNNRLRQRQNDLVTEIYTVLSETSDQLRPFAATTRAAVLLLAHWDAVQARARLGRRYPGKRIEVVEERSFTLHHTAHPMLWWSIPPESIVRNEVVFGEPTRTLLLTGPNTGGKTVLLKTLALAGLCARTGFPFPSGAEPPRVPFFDAFFVDLGDPQSIERQLSSFSGHIYRFKHILENLTGRSLVLLDELNSATDPEEGAALGRAFLETIMGRGALVVATTHDPNLKALAVSDPRILNASMQFDEGSRTPTYRIVLGVPGRSRALETAERLGIPKDILALARGYLSRQHNEFEAMMSRLEGDAAEATRARAEAERLRSEAAKLQKEWTERTEASVGEMLDRTRQRLRRVLEGAQEEVRATVRRLEELKANAASQSRRDLDATRAHLNEAFGDAQRQLESALGEEAPDIADALARKNAVAKPEPAAAGPRIEVGSSVRVPRWKTTGIVLETLPGGKITVAMGTLKTSMTIADVELLAPPKAPGGRARLGGGAADVAVPDSRLDLRGTRFEEAMAELARYLDQAYRSRALAQVTVVHGLGTGALREGTRQLLAKLPYVKDYRDGGAGGGGSGATIVEFDRD